MYRWFLTFSKVMREPEARGPLIAAGGLIVTGTIFYMIVEKWDFVDSLYFTVTTLTTVGFGNPSPTTDLGKLFTTVFVLSGVGMLLAVINAIGKAAVDAGPVRPGRRRDQEGAGDSEDVPTD
ncbi:MAG: potassium channel family protein [Solirubrobacterales bacterium]